MNGMGELYSLHFTRNVQIAVCYLLTLIMASPQQKAFCVLEFAKTKSIVTVQRAFQGQFHINAPSPKNIRRWFQQFQERGCLCKKKSPGRPRVSEANKRLGRILLSY